jgi:hypothetical protein
VVHIAIASCATIHFGLLDLALFCINPSETKSSLIPWFVVVFESLHVAFFFSLIFKTIFNALQPVKKAEAATGFLSYGKLISIIFVLLGLIGII